MKELIEFLEREIVCVSWGDYHGIKDLDMYKLVALKAMAELAIDELKNTH